MIAKQDGRRTAEQTYQLVGSQLTIDVQHTFSNTTFRFITEILVSAPYSHEYIFDRSMLDNKIAFFIFRGERFHVVFPPAMKFLKVLKRYHLLAFIPTDFTKILK